MRIEGIYNNLFGNIGILTNSRETELLQMIIKTRATGIDSFFNSTREQNTFLQKYELADLYEAYKAEPLIDSSIKIKDEIWQKAEFCLQAKQSNLPTYKWKMDLEEFRNFNHRSHRSRMKELTIEYKEYPYITQKQIEIMKTTFHSGDLWTFGIISDLLKTKYAIDNNITSELTLSSIDRVTDLHLLVAQNNIIDSGAEIMYLKDTPEEASQTINSKIQKALTDEQNNEMIYQNLKEAYDYQETRVLSHHRTYSVLHETELSFKDISQEAYKIPSRLSIQEFEVMSSNSKTVIADVSNTQMKDRQLSNYRILDKSIGKAEPLNVGDIDLSKQTPDSIKKLLSGSKVKLIDNKGTSNLYNLSKGPSGWALTIGKQLFGSMDAGSEA
jgi:hypothetical protein